MELGYEEIFRGKFNHDSLMEYVNTDGKKVSAQYRLGDEIEVYIDCYGEVIEVYKNGENILYKEEITPLISIVDACIEKGVDY